MALLIHCEKCGRDHLREMHCRPEDLAWKDKMDNWIETIDFKHKLQKLEERIAIIEKKLGLI